MDISKPVIFIGYGTCGIGAGAAKTLDAVEEYLKKNNIEAEIIKVGCLGICSMEPLLDVQLPGKKRISFHSATADTVGRILDGVFNSLLPAEYTFAQYHQEGLEEWKGIPYIDQTPFYSRQVRWVLSNCGIIDPIDLNAYIAYGGFSNLAKVLKHHKPIDIIDIIEKSGLRGRGGGGFSTGKKWRIANSSKIKEKYLVCNADEGDPGAFMDRAVIESDTYRLLEGVAISAYAIGAKTAYIYIRAEYPLAIKRLEIAIKEAERNGLLGDNILNSKFSLKVKIKKGAGAFVCGEETALIHSIEGKRGMPRPRPPYPAESGLFGKPTVINNVETLANVPVIMQLGWEKFASVGSGESRGTKVFALSGMVKKTGLVEVPMGVTIKEIVYDIAGGILGNKKCKAVQMGGPSGGCIPDSLLDVAIEYESLKKLGAIMGSGGMVVMDQSTCMVDLAKFFMEFIQSESCGKCIPCREGTKKMLETIKAITRGTHSEQKMDTLGRFQLITELESLAYKVKELSLCGLGQTAANPVLSTLRHFREEYEAHIFERNCPAGVCIELSGVPCQTGCPVETEVWRYVANISRGEYEEAYKVIRSANPMPSICARVCDRPCEKACRSGTTGGEPIAVRTLKRFVVDRVSPQVYHYDYKKADEKSNKIAIVGGGPSGITAAHYLSLSGNKITIFEQEGVLGGMLNCAIPSYRLPRQTLTQEIDSLLNENIEVKYNQMLGRDFDVESLLTLGYKSIYISIGAHKEQRLGVPGEKVAGVYPSIQYLKNFNLYNKNSAVGKVGIIGGGNSAIDSARVAIRQQNVESVSVFYRRTEDEMPAYREEIEAALAEGVKIVTLVSPVAVLSENDNITGLTLAKNKLGEPDGKGRRKPGVIENSNFDVSLDTLIIAVGEKPDTEGIKGLRRSEAGSLVVNTDTFETNIKGVFAGGDVITLPNAVIHAIAHGKKVSGIINRYLAGKSLLLTKGLRRNPSVYIEPFESDEVSTEGSGRIHPAELCIAERRCSFNEVELPVREDDAKKEALRCSRCDLTFTKTI
ncbi:MAG: hypothetical protein A2X47_03835 [Lentisphaerae bacterium GWF2_38_69]|nr:MAG: hypothetical protein A2X47_03835 [Lentisphaerae bacterium GWF2_38_69]